VASLNLLDKTSQFCIMLCLSLLHTEICFIQNLTSVCHLIQTSSEAHVASYPGGGGLWGLFCWVLSGQGLKLTMYLYLVPRLKMHVAVPPLPHTSSWCSAYLSTGTTLLYRIFMYSYNVSPEFHIHSFSVFHYEIKKVGKKFIV
jgi:hypothetical protein